MAGAVYIGDEANAAAWRLTGLQVRIAAAGTDIAGLFAEVRGHASFVLLSRSSAARLPAAILEQAQRAPTPLLLVLPDAASLAAGSALARSVRRQLGMEP